MKTKSNVFSKASAGLAVGLLAVLLAACGGSSGGSGGGSGSGNSYPAGIANAYPLPDSTAIPTNTRLLVEFSQGTPVDPTTVVDVTFAVLNPSLADPALNPILGTVVVRGDNQAALLTLPGNLNPSHQYAGVLTKVVKKLDGITPLLSKDFIWLFTTGTGTDGTAPTATINPANGATGVPVNSAVVITFNEFFDISAGGTVSVTPGPVAGGSVMNFMAKTVAFTPTTSLAANTTYTVNISGFKDMAGNGMAPIAPTFTTQ